MWLPLQILKKRKFLSIIRGTLFGNQLCYTINTFQSQRNVKIIQKNRFQFSICVRGNINPFENLTAHQLKEYYYNNRNPLSLNTLILLGQAMRKFEMAEFTDLLQTTKNLLMRQIKQNNENPQQIAFGKLVSLFVERLKPKSQLKSQSRTKHHGKSKIMQPPKEVLEAYINCYNYLTENISQHMIIYELLLKYSKKTSQTLRIAKQISEDKIKNFFRTENIKINADQFQLRDFIFYCRLFPNVLRDDKQYFLKVLLLKKQGITSLPRYEKNTLHYIMSVILERKQIAQVIGFRSAPLFDFLNDSAKQICMKLQLHKLHLNSVDATVVKYVQQGHLFNEAKNWDYDQLIWLSDFIPPIEDQSQRQGQRQCKTRKKIHQALIQTELGQVDHIIGYIGNQHEDYYESLSEWLASHDLSDQEEKKICDVLIYIGKYGKKFLKFHQRVVHQSLGKYEWETLNTIYYFGLLWQSKDQNMQFVRRYILNEYIAKGTSRRDIPTTSYFYKILQITNVEQFYENYFKMT